MDIGPLFEIETQPDMRWIMMMLTYRADDETHGGLLNVQYLMEKTGFSFSDVTEILYLLFKKGFLSKGLGENEYFVHMRAIGVE